MRSRWRLQQQVEHRRGLELARVTRASTTKWIAVVRRSLLFFSVAFVALHILKKQQEGLFYTDETHQIFTVQDMNANFSGILPRAFEPWPSQRPLPCFSPDKDLRSHKVQKTPSQHGFLYIKPYKTGSSTASGINLRIARNVARRLHKHFDFCQARFQHGPTDSPATFMFQNRTEEKSFLWTIIREPTKRLTSAFFHFKVSRKNAEPTDENFQSYLKTTKRDYYIRSLHVSKRFKSEEHDAVETANQILDEYDFIGVTDRMDESAVALMMLLNLRMADILYVSTKTKGSYDAGKGNGSCTYIEPSFVSEGMQNFFDSDFWRDQIRQDLALYEAVNKSLDLTIDRLGRTGFEANVARFRQAKKMIAIHCLPNVTFPCMDGGKYNPPNKTDCLWKDSGCGTGCLDEIATKLDLW
jgi:hypothetical protein